MKIKIVFNTEEEYDGFLKLYDWDEKILIIQNTIEKKGIYTIKGNEKLKMKYEKYKNI